MHNWTSVLILLACTLRKVRPVGNDVDISIFRKADCTLKFQNLSQQAKDFFFLLTKLLLNFKWKQRNILALLRVKYF